MTSQLATQIQEDQATLMEKVLIEGNLAKLSPSERLSYYRRVCESLNLNPLTRPFQYITFQGKLTLYASKDCTEQLRRKNQVSLAITNRETAGDLYVVTARASIGDRYDEDQGAVPIAGLTGEALSNAYMKATTKAKRRVTLSICGLGWLDESEIESIPGARVVEVDMATGEVLADPKEQRALPKPATNAREGPVNGHSAAPAPRPVSTSARCEIHGVKLARHPSLGMVHKRQDGTFCNGNPPEDGPPPEREHTPDPEGIPADLPPSQAMDLEALQAAVRAANLTWDRFEADYLKMTWPEWIKLGGGVQAAQMRLRGTG